jgi:transcriptional regulator with XRE-family HTH domain
MFILTELGAALRRARTERGLTQAALAERAGIPRLKVIQVEAGDERVAVRYYAMVSAALGQHLGLKPARRPTLDELQRENAA